MPRRILIVPDKFKGTLTAGEAARSMARGWRRTRPDDRLDLLPMSDGGDGFGVVMAGLLKARRRSTMTVDAAHRPLRAPWWWCPSSRTAIVESASVVGLARLPKGRFHPFELDTFGLGGILRAAARIGARHCLVGVGGSATNDGGFGMACALGWSFLNRRQAPLQRWIDLHELTRIVPPANNPWKHLRVTVAIDVQNPLLGARGASRVYGPQKGLRKEDMLLAEKCLRRLASVVRDCGPEDLSTAPGAGAAGGLGFGLFAFLGASAEPGVDLFARQARLMSRMRRASLVLTGEGSIDPSTLMGKGVGEIARLCKSVPVPCIGLAGRLGRLGRSRGGFTRLYALTPEFVGVKTATTHPARSLAGLAARVATDWSAQEALCPP